ncbi:MAG: carbohydrate-binding domain-containing protein [Clostridia bacterium]|nr:carbohydrate-binding domain-containing protein [Clostridia bacterium]
MKTNKIICLLTALAVLLAALGLPAFAGEETDVSTLYKAKDVTDTWDDSEAVHIDLSDVTDGALTVSQAGDYLLSGSLDGQIVVEAPKDAKVRLILNGVTVTSASGPAVYEKQADKLIVTLAEGSVNTLTAGSPVTDGDDTVGAALYAEDDLSLNGKGALYTVSGEKHGIQSKADLIIANGFIQVQAGGDGIRGRNSVLVLDGSITVNAGGDGIVATRDDKDGKGWVLIAGGSLSITTGSGAGEVRPSANSQMGRGGWNGRNSYAGASSDSGVSQKGIKAATDLTVQGGTLTLDCADDGLHAVNVTVSGGTLSILSGDDGIHADELALVSGGTVDIAQSYEGIEGKDVSVSGGYITVVSSDDAVNASGGSDGSGFAGGWGQRGGFGAGDGTLAISGGELYVSAGGDGLDSNGSILITGGVTGVWAVTNGGEGTIDFTGTGSITGGTLIVASTQGSMFDSGTLSGQAMMYITLSSAQAAGSEVAVRDANGNVLASFTPKGAFNTLTVSCASLSAGDQMSVTAAGQTVYSGQMTDNYASSAGGWGNPGGFGGQGGWGNPGGFGSQGGRGGRGR